MRQRMFWIQWGLLSALGTSPVQAWSGLKTHLDLMAYSQPVSVHDFSREWQGKFYGGEVAFTRDRASVSANLANWSLAAIARYDYYIDFHRDTAELYYLKANHLALDPDKSYQLKLNVFNLSGTQYRLGRAFELTPDLNVTLGASFVQGQLLQDGTIKGRSLLDAQGAQQFSADLDYYYNEDKLLDRTVDGDISGYGFTADLQLDWQASADLSVQLLLDDIAGRVWWQDAPYTNARVTSEVTSTNSAGGIQFNPVLSGKETYQDYQQKLRLYGQLATSYTVLGNWHLDANWQHYAIFDFYNIGGGYGQQGKEAYFRLYYAPKIEMVSLSAGWSWLNLTLGTDSMQMDEARVWKFGLNLQLGY